MGNSEAAIYKAEKQKFYTLKENIISKNFKFEIFLEEKS